MVIFCIFFLGVFYLNHDISKWSSVYSGLFTAFLVASIQLSLSYYEFKKLRKYEKLGIIDIVKHRRGKNEYGNIIRKSKKEICLMGNTASRFMNDFANQDVDGNNALLTALTNGASVRILLPNYAHLPDDTHPKLKKTIDMSSKLSNHYGDKFKIRFFNAQPSHSILIIDDQSIIGPIFNGIESQHSPAITTSNISDFSKPYIEYFNNTWDLADSNAQ